MEKRMVKIVVVKHPNCPGHFVFQVPEFAALEAGDLVFMDTSRGKDQMAVCITPCFYINPDMLKEAYNTTPEKLRLVKGELFKHEYKTDEEFERLPQNEKTNAHIRIEGKAFDAR